MTDRPFICEGLPSPSFYGDMAVWLYFCLFFSFGLVLVSVSPATLAHQLHADWSFFFHLLSLIYSQISISSSDLPPDLHSSFKPFEWTLQ